MKDVTIIGGGISGLTAGIYAQLSGLQSEIYERHTIVGGQCTSWTRNGFHIDNCVHWMTGTNPKTELYQLWTDVGVLGNGQELLKHDYFLQVNIDGVKAHVWRDLNKMQDELLAIAPEDAKEIRSFIKAIKDFQAISTPALKPNEQMNFWDKMKMLSMIKALPVARKFGTMSIDDYIKRFKNPTIKALISNYLPKQYYVLATFFMYAMFTTGNADLPLGGSDMITNRMRDTYLSLGGEIHCRKKANKFIIENQRVTKVEFEDGSATETKNVICTTDRKSTRPPTHPFRLRYLAKHIWMPFLENATPTKKVILFSPKSTCTFPWKPQLRTCQLWNCLIASLLRLPIERIPYYA